MLDVLVTLAIVTSNANRLMLIDGHSMAFRAFYALPAENFSTSGGQATNAVYGFLSMLSSLLVEEKPTHVAVAFDVGRQTFRTEMFPEYKAQREAAPPEFKGQVEIIKEVLETLGITTLEKENFEADDIIATLATAAGPLGFDTYIVTGDRDSFQLVNESTTVLYPMRGVSVLHRFTPEAVEEKYGLTPVQYPDFAALRGDPSDNLPNIPGVGEKTATKWIVQYGNLDSLLAHADEIKGKAGNSFRERLDQVRMNRTLTEMVKDLELPYAPDQLERKPADASAIASKFDELEFGSNLRDRVIHAVDAQGNVSEEPEEDKPEVVIDHEKLASWLATRAGQSLALYVRGHGSPASGDAESAAIVDKQSHAVALDFGDLDADDDQAFAQWIASDSPKYLHEAKAVFHMLAGRGYTLNGIEHDTAIAGYLLRPGQRTYDLKDVYQRHLQRQLGGGSSESGQLSLLDAPNAQELVDSAVAILELSKSLTAQLQAIDAYELYREMELPLVGVLARMEATGICVDVATLREQRDIFVEQVKEEESAARELAGDETLNLSSPKQLQVVLFDTLGLPKTKKTKTGYSTAAKEIESLAVKNPHPFLDHLLAHREFQKMKTTLDGLIKAVGDDGRIHTTFNQTVASTGRLSSTEPNLQNIPVRTPAGRKIRSAFVVGQGYKSLLTADYSQIEMRVMAHLSEDPGLIEAYQTGEDLHNFVGSKVFDVPVDQVTPELRRRVKAMSYGLVYGLSAFGLSQQLNIPAGEAKVIMESYFERFGGVKRYLDQVVEQARKDGFTSTLFGRRRYLPELSSDNRVARENAERAALNAPIQGTAADIIKIAMLRVDARLTAENCQSRVLLQVHDELVLEVASGEQEKVQQLVEEEMDAAISLRVPLEVSAGVGTNWEEAAH
ncbi:DNA polymerase I [Corynebacterium diphtheriae bv. mitis]|uniref:DNA polymerase I n=1 Tax=Corynebacterium diphtheriae TaxID=1717 RepID=A0A811G562_CORDP|nr:DNA polymerase I [Corynebacterium diphtheriae]MBG9359871.1 DNA polymerase I [Corynebacterium diphtheriae bv. mitis]MBG9361911.1 DNA polymerase I [Corynebacterium diphtheriae bv. mitis]MBG9364087.1 DNA polymerase I [Corynebacterium diphtheriae bv. mitis]MBG9366318.1 DNA polymerase I [Corynebacterium diphtheriae bv. mitis]MCM0018175.1 DNA polymerase I [Corynebacterium diphtheriae bv. mitis]